MYEASDVVDEGEMIVSIATLAPHRRAMRHNAGRVRDPHVTFNSLTQQSDLTSNRSSETDPFTALNIPQMRRRIVLRWLLVLVKALG